MTCLLITEPNCSSHMEVLMVRKFPHCSLKCMPRTVVHYKIRVKWSVWLGLHEAVYHGVPMLCVPLFGDQHRNAKMLKVWETIQGQIQKRPNVFWCKFSFIVLTLTSLFPQANGYGLNFRLLNFTEDEVLIKINEVLSNPSYRYAYPQYIWLRKMILFWVPLMWYESIP